MCIRCVFHFWSYSVVEIEKPNLYKLNWQSLSKDHNNLYACVSVSWFIKTQIYKHPLVLFPYCQNVQVFTS